MGTNKQKKLKRLKERMASDEGLPLKKESTNLVFGDGNEDCEILFVGEGPGYWEDQKGIPFVGAAGAFLNQLLSLIKIPREEVFITNIIHYRAPLNRDPEESEIAAFRPYLDEIINIIEPKIIVTLGRFSMSKFLGNVRISSVHGKSKKVVFNEREIVVVPMYHPAAGLRSTETKRKIIDDFKTLPEMLTNFDKVKEEKEKSEKNKQLELV